MTRHFATAPGEPIGDRSKHRPKGWTPERRARQAAVARRCQPWRYSTGPKTDAGKARCAKNALRHGFRSREWQLELQRVRHALRLAARNVAAIRTFMRARAWRAEALRQRRILAGLRKQMMRPCLAEAAKQRRQVVPQDRIELSTYPLPRGCATTTLLRH